MIKSRREKNFDDIGADDNTVGRRDVCQCTDFCSDTVVFSSAWISSGIWKNVKKWIDTDNYKDLHFYHARNSADAAADGGIFWTVLSV